MLPPSFGPEKEHFDALDRLEEEYPRSDSRLAPGVIGSAFEDDDPIYLAEVIEQAPLGLPFLGGFATNLSTGEATRPIKV